ncbi:MAG: hypothetical protein KDA32_13290, partial [Phycisphaerales bacterium]|nr:hypothetical protein [Phycisphaerales bacterium]
GRIGPDALLRDMYAVAGERQWAGFDAYRAMVARMPLMWPIWPLLWLWPIPTIGRRIYRRVADTRSCSVGTPWVEQGMSPGRVGQASCLPNSAATDGRQDACPTQANDGDLGRGQAAMVVGAALIAGMIGYGVPAVVRGWPFACYPTFGYLYEEPVWDEIAVEAIDADGGRRRLPAEVFLSELRPARRVWLVKAIVRTTDPALRAKRLEAMLNFGGGPESIMPRPAALEFFEEQVSTIPEDRDQPPLSRKLLHRLELE